VITNCCDKSPFGGEDDRLMIMNKSHKRLYVYPQINYPDTSIADYNPSNDEKYEIQPNSSKRIISRSWDQLVSSCDADTLMIFIYDAELVDSTNWDIVIKDYLILKRFDLSLEDFLTTNWTLSYP
jgi:hypothetical protein